MIRTCHLAIVLLLVAAAIGRALASPPDLGSFAYQQKPGNQVSLDATFRNRIGRTVRLGDMIAGRPTILALGYFHCPSLCGVVRDDLLDALSRSNLRAGRDYSLVIVSIDPHEQSADAAAAKREDMGRYELPGASEAWHYLTGTPDQIQLIENVVGFRAQFDPRLKQFLHPSGIVFLTGSGKVSSYLLGVGYQPGDVGLAVTRARSGGIAKAALPVLLLCFHFNPTTGRYTLAISKLLEIGCIVTVLTVGGTIVLALCKEKQRPQ
jgi:protein SCO1/2